MKLNIKEQVDININENELEIIIKYKNNNENIKELIDYIKNYNHNKIIVTRGYETILIDYKDIYLFYSEKKYNYCKTKDGIFRIKSKLYELEDLEDFIRISKRCIVNINFIRCFDTSQTGKIIVKLYDGTE